MRGSLWETEMERFNVRSYPASGTAFAAGTRFGFRLCWGLWGGSQRHPRLSFITQEQALNLRHSAALACIVSPPSGFLPEIHERRRPLHGRWLGAATGWVFPAQESQKVADLVDRVGAWLQAVNPDAPASLVSPQAQRLERWRKRGTGAPTDLAHCGHLLATWLPRDEISQAPGVKLAFPPQSALSALARSVRGSRKLVEPWNRHGGWSRRDWAYSHYARETPDFEHWICPISSAEEIRSLLALVKRSKRWLERTAPQQALLHDQQEQAAALSAGFWGFGSASGWQELGTQGLLMWSPPGLLGLLPGPAHGQLEVPAAWLQAESSPGLSTAATPCSPISEPSNASIPQRSDAPQEGQSNAQPNAQLDAQSTRQEGAHEASPSRGSPQSAVLLLRAGQHGKTPPQLLPQNGLLAFATRGFLNDHWLGEDTVPESLRPQKKWPGPWPFSGSTKHVGSLSHDHPWMLPSGPLLESFRMASPESLAPLAPSKALALELTPLWRHAAREARQALRELSAELGELHQRAEGAPAHSEQWVASFPALLPEGTTERAEAITDPRLSTGSIQSFKVEASPAERQRYHLVDSQQLLAQLNATAEVGSVFLLDGEFWMVLDVSSNASSNTSKSSNRQMLACSKISHRLGIWWSGWGRLTKGSLLPRALSKQLSGGWKPSARLIQLRHLLLQAMAVAQYEPPSTCPDGAVDLTDLDAWNHCLRLSLLSAPSALASLERSLLEAELRQPSPIEVPQSKRKTATPRTPTNRGQQEGEPHCAHAEDALPEADPSPSSTAAAQTQRVGSPELLNDDPHDENQGRRGRSGRARRI